MVKSEMKAKLCEELIESGIEENSVIRHSYTSNRLNNGNKNKKRVESQDKGLAPTLDTRCDCLGVAVKSEFTDIEKQLFTEDGNIKRYLGGTKVDKFKEGQMATTTYPNGYGHGPRTHDESIALNTIDRPCVKKNLRIRKLTPCECIKLMGFERKDYQAMRDIGMTDAQIYHCAGDSIVSTVLMGIFGELLGIDDYTERIEEYAERITKE